MYLVTPAMETFATPQPTNSTEPTGGVTLPRPMFMMSMIPNCTSLMPMLRAIGRKMGVKIRTAGVRSRNMPMTARKMFMISRMTNLLLEMLISAWLIAAGMPVKDMT